MKHRVFRTILIFLSVAALAAVGVTLINRSRKAGQALPVGTYTVERGSLVEQVTGSGSFTPPNSATMTARVSGQIVSIPVDEGDRVTAGKVLMQIDPSDYRLAVDQARSTLETTRRNVKQNIVTLRASYRSAATALDQAKRSYDKNRELFAGKAISGDELAASKDSYTTASVNLQSAREQLNLRLGRPLGSEPPLDSSQDDAIVKSSPEVLQAQLSLKSALDNLDRCTVTSLIDGTVTSVVPKVGDLISPNSPLVKVEDLSEMLAEVQIDEVDIGKLSVGNEVEVTSDSLIGQTLKGSVTSIAPTIETVGSTRVSTVKVSLDPAGAQLRSGASCSVKITSRTKQAVLNIPITAFISRGGEEKVFVLTPLAADKEAQTRGTKPEVYRLEERTIATGISTINAIEVTKGLSAGEVIASGALNQLRGGMLVIRKDSL